MSACVGRSGFPAFQARREQTTLGNPLLSSIGNSAYRNSNVLYALAQRVQTASPPQPKPLPSAPISHPSSLILPPSSFIVSPQHQPEDRRLP